jgi:two-component system, response regulator RegA
MTRPADIAIMRAAPGGKLILVVEDEARLREPLAHLLGLRHFEVITAATVESALALLQTHKPDGAIVDLQLNGGSGRDVIVRMPTGVPVIIFSGMRSASGELERLRPRTRLIEKPASLTWLIDALEEMLRTTREYAAS